MGTNPINLGLRFILEIVALGTFGTWGYHQTSSGLRWVIALFLPLLFASLWGIFAVPDDPSRSGGAPVVISGLLRLILELSFFSLTSIALFNLGYTKPTWIFSCAVVLHYLFSYDRILWLLER